MNVKYDREEFRKYLLDSGVVPALARVFLKLYELKENRPKSAIKYIQDHVADKTPSFTEYEALKNDLNALGDILTEFKMSGKLDSLNATQLVVIEKFCSRTNDCSRTNEPAVPFKSNVGARHSIEGDALKTWNMKASKIRQMKISDPDYDMKIKEKIKDLLSDANCDSLLKKCITEDIYEKYKSKTTPKGATIVECISSGLDIHDSLVGVYAVADDVYNEFTDLFDPIITLYHNFKINTHTHPPLDWGDPNSFKDLDPNNKYIVSTRIRCSRNVTGYPMVPKMNKEQFLDLCQRIKTVFQKVFTGAGDLNGTFYELSKLDATTKNELMGDGYILEYGDKYLQSAGATDFWPDGRAVYINDNKSFFVWVNEEDHLRFIAMETGSNFSVIYNRLREAVDKCSTELSFEKHPDFGYFCLCPTNWGNTIRASVVIRARNLVQQKNLQKLVEKHKLELRGIPGPDNSYTCEISNKKKIGLTEYESVKQLYDGIEEIIQREEQR